MARDRKSAATIRRRRRGHVVHHVITRHKAHALDDTWDSGEEDPEPALQPSQVGFNFCRRGFGFLGRAFENSSVSETTACWTR